MAREMHRVSIMTNNTANWDRILRVVAGLALLSLVFLGPQTPVGWVGLVLVLTGLVGFCPLYTLVGINTCRVKPSESATRV